MTRRRRPGYLLLEVLVVMAAMALLLGVSISVVLGVLRTQEADAALLQRLTAQAVVADLFRADVAAADAAPPRAGKYVASERCLILRRPDRSLVVYDATADRLERIEIGSTGEERRPLPRSPHRTRHVFGRGDGKRLFALRCVETRGTSDAPVQHVVEFSAALGGDWR